MNWNHKNITETLKSLFLLEGFSFPETTQRKLMAIINVGLRVINGLNRLKSSFERIVLLDFIHRLVSQEN
jgi:hypothetical protein